jgi:hypothetical protein
MTSLFFLASRFSSQLLEKEESTARKQLGIRTLIARALSFSCLGEPALFIYLF